MNTAKEKIELSIVCTIYNDAAVVSRLVEEIIRYTDQLKVNYEIILVNDYSTDESEKVIVGLCEENPCLKALTLSRNYGQQIAMSAGIRSAEGEYVLIMDGDLQNPPSEIPRLYYEILKGYDTVYTVSKIRNNLVDRFSSFVFWLMLTKLFCVEIVPNQLMLKIMSREFVSRFNGYDEINRTVAGIVRDISSNYAVLIVQNSVRIVGESHYSFVSRLNLLIDIVISLSNAPLNIMIYFGFAIFSITNVFSLIFFVNYFFYDVPAGFTSIILVLFFFGSLTVLLLGFIGRYLANIYTEVRRRPLFHVKKYYNMN